MKSVKTTSIQNRKLYKNSTAVAKMSVILCLLCCLTSCPEGDPPNYTISIDTYVITFSGDTNEFKGLVSISTISEKCRLNSNSFDDYTINSLSDSEFKESYEFTVKYYNHIPPKIQINCSALCFSDEHQKMSMNVYKMSSDGSVLRHEEFHFNSFPIGSAPSYEDYSFKITI